MNTLSILTKKLQEAARSHSYCDEMDQCERMYSAKFISGQKPVKAGDLDFYELRHEFTFDQEEAEVISFSEWQDNMDYDDDHSVEAYNRWLKYSFKRKTLISPDTLMVEVCNYKGEGEGYAIYEAVKTSPIFHSKNESFNSFGA